jgi:SAM-dependent methyltransferase
MTEMFGSVYADAYNSLYADKDYSAECDLIERLFEQYSESDVSSVLDLGCGTGCHALPLSRNGYEVVGVDRAATMLASAEKSVAAADVASSRVRFEKGDIRSINLGRTFDAALMMFAVLGYQIENEDILAALRTARRHLRVGGLLILDYWYGPAVLRERPSDRVKIIQTESGRILRTASGALDTSRHTCAVRFHLWQLRDDRLIAETEETHMMRFFFPQELKFFLDCSGLRLLRLGAFPDVDKDPDETTWSSLAVACAF